VAWGAAIVLAVELAFREIARRSLLHAIIGGSASAAALVVASIVCAAVAIAATRGRRAAGRLLTACFALGVALQLQLGARLQSDGFYYFAYLRSLAFDRDVNFMNDRATTICSRRTASSPIRCSHTGVSTWAPTVRRATTGCSAKAGTRPSGTAQRRSGGRRRRRR
jgi:hypothetical protein